MGFPVMGFPGEEASLAEDRVLFPEAYHFLREAEEVHVGVHQPPVDPGDLVVLAVGVVVPLLGPPELVSAQEHRDPLGEEEGGDEVADLPRSHPRDELRRVRALDAQAAAQVVVLAVGIILAVFDVTLLPVAHQVVQSEPVMAGDEVDALQRTLARRAVQVGAAGDAGREVPGAVRVAAPEPPYVVAVLAVPFGPPARELAHLVGPGGVPRLGDDLGVPQYRVLVDDLYQGRVAHDVAVLVPSQDRGQVEAEPVDVHVDDPVAEHLEDEFADQGVVAVEGVAAAGEVGVETPVLFKDVVDGIVYPAEGNRRPGLVALGGMVEDNVEDDLNASLVEGADHVPELLHLLPHASGR